MKKVFTILSFFFIATSGYSQYFEFTDSNLRDKFKSIAPECFDGDKMDTTCTKLSEITGIYFADSEELSYNNLNGLQYLKNLTSISADMGYSGLGIDKRYVPKSLRKLYLETYPIEEEYFNTLGSYYIDELESIDTVIIGGIDDFAEGRIQFNYPKRINYLEIYGCNVETYGAPDSINELRISGCGSDVGRLYSELNVPTNVKKLSLKYIEISNSNTVPLKFNEGLEELSIEEIKVYSTLKLEFPQSLKKLACQYLKNIEIDTLPNQNLRHLTLRDVGLNILPSLPEILDTLVIPSNNINYIESLPPDLKYLDVSYNKNLKCLPTLPASLKSINVSGTKVTCIPNETDKIKATIALPLCPNPCGEIPDLLSGLVFLDINKNGKFDYYGPDRRIQGAFIHVNDRLVTTNSSGSYRIYADTDIENKLSVSYYHPHLDKILPAQRTYTNSGNSEKIDTMNFAVQLKDMKDIEVLVSPFTARNGFTSQVNITVKNRGNVNVNESKLSVHLPLDWTIVNTYPAAQSIVDTILWENISLSIGESKTYIAKLTVPASATINTPYAITAKVHNVVDDFSPGNNTNTYSSVIRGSYDPNDKLVTPEVLTPNYTEGTELLYTVRFQNTGNDTAFRVVVIDTILENLDPLSLRMIESSHSVEWYLNENREVSFIFDNILLPDSNVNEAASHGYVTFAIKPLPNLASGTAIQNRAGIYFDFNAPIITNYATSNVEIITLINEKSALQLNVYPNPSNNILNIRWAEGGKTNLTITDISGKIIFQSTEAGNFKQLPTQNFSKGMYIIQIQNEKGLGLSKIIVQ